jgi:hypothetical protein
MAPGGVQNIPPMIGGRFDSHSHGQQNLQGDKKEKRRNIIRSRIIQLCNTPFFRYRKYFPGFWTRVCPTACLLAHKKG